MEIYRAYYHGFIKPFLKWVHDNQIQTFVDVIGDIGFIFLIPLVSVCAVLFIICAVKFLREK